MIILLNILTPLLLIGIIAYRRQSNFLNWVLTIISFGLVLMFMWITVRWEIISVYYRKIFPFLYLVACIYSYKRIIKGKVAINKVVKWTGISVNILLIFFMSVFNGLALRGYLTPKNTIDMSSPLRGGNYVIINGGSRPMVNAHFHVNPQSYALDIVGLNKWGMRSSLFSGGSNLTYEIYDDTVFSPCEGKVLAIMNNQEDLIPPNTDTQNPAGNYILIEHHGLEILLAHLKKGSIVVSPGDSVTTKDRLGQVGNSGNTSEPHLHMHIEKGGDAHRILNGIGVPFTINGKFLLRGDNLNN